MQKKLRYSWILPDQLAVGERPDTLTDLQSMGFTAALSLQEEHESGPDGDAPPDFSWSRVPIPDGIWGGVPALPQLHKAVETINRFLKEKRRTYVYCYAGVGRSPLACMAYLARYRNLGLGEAYRRVSMDHPPTGPSSGQLAALGQYLAGSESKPESGDSA